MSIGVIKNDFFFSGGGEMGKRIRNFPWENTSLGSYRSWHQSLRTSISICLNSSIPIALYWGPQLLLLYNDAWGAIAGNKHPWVLGQPAKSVWKEIWEEIEPEFIKAMHGEPAIAKDILPAIQQYTYMEESYYDFNFTPVPDEHGNIAGIFNTVIENTTRIAKQRDLAPNQTNQLFEQLPSGIQLLRGPDFVFEFANDHALIFMNLRSDEVIGKCFEQVIPGAKQQGLIDLLKRVYETGEKITLPEIPVHYYFKGIKRKSFARFVYAPLYGNDGKVTGIMVISDDVTDQVETRRKAEESGKELQELVKLAPIAITLLEGKDLVVKVSSATALSLMGKNEKDVLDKPLASLFPELPERTRVYREVYNTGIPYQGKEVEVRFSRFGELYTGYYDLNYVPWYDTEKNIKGVMSVGVEVTEMVLARRKLEESEKQFRTLTETLPQLVWMTDEKGTQLYVSRRWEQYSGLTPNGIETWQKIVHADDMQLIEQNWANSILTGNNYQSEVRLRSKTGEYRWHFVQGEPLKNSAGKITRWIGAFADIHDQKKFSENLEIMVKARTTELSEKNIALENSESFLQQLLDSSIELISVIDRNFNFIAVNKQFEQEMNIRRNNLYGKNLFEVNPGMLNTEKHAAVLKALNGERVFLSKKRSIARPDYYLDTYFIPLTIQNNIEGVIILSRNITDIVLSEIQLKDKNAALELSNKELESFTYVASHDLQEPLRKIQTFIHLMRKNWQDHEMAEKYFGKIEASAQRMSELIRSVLTYSHISRTGEKFTDTDLEQTLANVKNDFELLIEEKNARIVHNILPVIKANPLQMQQLFSNIISNALKFSHENPIIHIEAKKIRADEIPLNNTFTDPEQPFIELSFTDNGIGFEQEFAEQIFNLFQRLHGKNEYPGTGIGLGIVKKIVDLHRGYITSSSNPGKGSTFTLWIPENGG